MKIATLNTWGTTAPYRERVSLMLSQSRALAPDVLALQEVGVDEQGGGLLHDLAADGWNIVSELGSAGAEFSEGLAIASRSKILRQNLFLLPDAEPDTRRMVLSALVHQGTSAWWIHCTHLSYELSGGLRREQQVLAADAHVASLEGGQGHVLAGDMNADPDSDEMRFLRGLCSLDGRRTYWQDAWQVAHPDERGYSWCTSLGEEREARSVPVDRRLDYIFVSPREKSGLGSVQSCQLGFDVRNSNGLCASDHFGVVAQVAT